MSLALPGSRFWQPCLIIRTCERRALYSRAIRGHWRSCLSLFLPSWFSEVRPQGKNGTFQALSVSPVSSLIVDYVSLLKPIDCGKWSICRRNSLLIENWNSWTELGHSYFNFIIRLPLTLLCRPVLHWVFLTFLPRCALLTSSYSPMSPCVRKKKILFSMQTA